MQSIQEVSVKTSGRASFKKYRDLENEILKTAQRRSLPKHMKKLLLKPLS